MTIQKIFESLDESVFTNELKQTLSEKFDSAVEERAEAKAIILAEELAEFKIDELEEKVEQYGEYLREQHLTKSEELNSRVSEYVDLVVEEFVSEAKEALGESLKSEHSDMLIEAFDSMLIAGGVEFASILEAKGQAQEAG